MENTTDNPFKPEVCSGNQATVREPDDKIVQAIKELSTVPVTGIRCVSIRRHRSNDGTESSCGLDRLLHCLLHNITPGSLVGFISTVVVGLLICIHPSLAGNNYSQLRRLSY